MSPHNEPRSASSDSKEQYFPWFDWLRATCACVVMYYHGHVLTWTQSGSFAVQVFFALSGWLIGGILLKLEPAALPRFYFNRAVRIWVPYYLAGALLLTLSALREPITAKWIEIVTYKATFVYNLFGVPQLLLFHDAMPQKGSLSHFWSVNVEEQFYLVAPIFLVLLAKRFGRSPWLWAALAVVGTEFGLGAIMLGVFAATLVSRLGPIHLNTKVRIAMVLGLAACVVGLATDLDYQRISPIAGLLIVLLLAVPGRRSTWGTIFGGMSYPLYLNHWIGLFVANYVLVHVHLGAADWPIYIVVIAIVNIGFAAALYWWIDRQLLSHRSGWYSPRRGAVVAVCAYAIIAVGLVYGFAMQPKFERAKRAAAAAGASAAATGAMLDGSSASDPPPSTPQSAALH